MWYASSSLPPYSRFAITPPCPPPLPHNRTEVLASSSSHHHRQRVASRLSTVIFFAAYNLRTCADHLHIYLYGVCFVLRSKYPSVYTSERRSKNVRKANTHTRIVVCHQRVYYTTAPLRIARLYDGNCIIFRTHNISGWKIPPDRPAIYFLFSLFISRKAVCVCGWRWWVNASRRISFVEVYAAANIIYWEFNTLQRHFVYMTLPYGVCVCVCVSLISHQWHNTRRAPVTSSTFAERRGERCIMRIIKFNIIRWKYNIRGEVEGRVKNMSIDKH